MNKVILVILFCLVGFGVAGQQKSIISVEKPKPVVLNLPQQKFVSNLGKAGGALIGSAILFSFGTILKSNNNPNAKVGSILQIGGGASLFYSGICITKAADAYEKSLVVKKKD